MAHNRTIVLAAGGTGGHLFPAQALAAEMQHRGWDVHLATDGRAERFAGFFDADHIHSVPSGTISKNPLKLAKAAFKIAPGHFAAKRLIETLQPRLAVGFGGYPSVLPLLAASRAGVPIVLHEQNAVMGRANRWLAPRAAKICTGFQLSDDSGHASKLVITGNPVRPAIVEAAALPYVPSSEDGDFDLLVFGGSQGARFFSHIMPDVVAGMPFDAGMRLKITQQARPEDEAGLRAFYEKHEIAAEVAPFFGDMATRLANAHFVICRAGASTVSELAVIGRPSLLVPYPFALDHDQATNAQSMVQAGGATVCAQSELSADVLREVLIGAMNDPRQLAQQAENARSTAQPNAAALLGDVAEAIAATHN